MNFLKSIVHKLSKRLGLLISLFISYRLFNHFQSIVWHPLYTAWISKEFKEFGEGSIIKSYVTYLCGQQYISIGQNTVLGSRIQLTAWNQFKEQCFTPEIVIGDNCNIGESAHITAINSIQIGNGVLTGKRILITDNAHGEFSKENCELAPSQRKLYSKGSVIIDDNVWIGEKVSIIGEVHIGRSSVIAANSVVTHDVPPYSIVGGIPAKIIKQL